MILDQRWTARVGQLQGQLRAYAFGEELEREAGELIEALQPLRRRRAGTGDRLTLKALALAAEYLDARARGEEAQALLSRTAIALLDGEMGRQGDDRLHRQQAWCCLAYALALLRSSRQGEAGQVIGQLRQYVEGRLTREDFPCHGTVALLRYYSGLWRRNTGALEAAARDFDAALDRTRRRYEDKRVKFEGCDAARLRRELIYSRVMTARILGFGQGGVALARGRYAEARGWMAGASLVLSGLGQDSWRRSLEVYERSAAVMLEAMEAGAAERFRQQGRSLGELEVWFRGVNRRSGYVAGAYGLLAEVRARQLEAGFGTIITLRGLESRLNGLLTARGGESGPMTASAGLVLVECLLRAGQYERCERQLLRFGREHARDEEIESERRLLEAELWLETGRRAEGLRSVRELSGMGLASGSRRTRARVLTAVAEWRAGKTAAARQSWLEARESAAAAGDGYSQWVTEEVGQLVRGEAPEDPMPYQREEDPLWCDMDHNLERARLNVIRALVAREPGASMERLAAAAGRGVSWLYALLARHREEEWVARLLNRPA